MPTPQPLAAASSNESSSPESSPRCPRSFAELPPSSQADTPAPHHAEQPAEPPPPQSAPMPAAPAEPPRPEPDSSTPEYVEPMRQPAPPPPPAEVISPMPAPQPLATASASEVSSPQLIPSPPSPVAESVPPPSPVAPSRTSKQIYARVLATYGSPVAPSETAVQPGGQPRPPAGPEGRLPRRTAAAESPPAAVRTCRTRTPGPAANRPPCHAEPATPDHGILQGRGLPTLTPPGRRTSRWQRSIHLGQLRGRRLARTLPPSTAPAGPPHALRGRLHPRATHRPRSLCNHAVVHGHRTGNVLLAGYWVPGTCPGCLPSRRKEFNTTVDDSLGFISVQDGASPEPRTCTANRQSSGSWNTSIDSKTSYVVTCPGRVSCCRSSPASAAKSLGFCQRQPPPTP